MPPAPGQAQANRTDLNNAAAQGPGVPAQPIRVAPGGPQGQRQELEASQGAVPLPDSDAQMRMANVAAQQMEPPPAFDRPTEFPSEPLTSGMNMGPGLGAESAALQLPQFDNSDRLIMADWIPVLELLAGRPGTSQATRNMVRQMRSQMPPDINYTQL